MLAIKLMLLLYIIIKILITHFFFQMPVKYVDELTLTIDGVYIERVNQFNSLGFTVISHLNCSNYIDKIANICSRTIGFITKLEHIIQTKIQM